MDCVFSNVKVLDFSSTAAGPLSTAILADMGAEVYKVERLPLICTTRRARKSSAR